MLNRQIVLLIMAICRYFGAILTVELSACLVCNQDTHVAVDGNCCSWILKKRWIAGSLMLSDVLTCTHTLTIS